MLKRMKWPDWKNWLRTARPVQEKAHLGRRYIYILPTRHGLLFGLILIAMLIGSINYTLSLGFVLTFLLAGLGVVAMLHTWRNLAHLSLTSGKITPVFAGEPVRWHVTLEDHDQRSRYAISLRVGKGPVECCDIAPEGRTQATVTLQTRQRGWLSPGRLTVFTDFPLGLFHAWSYAQLASRCLVYPAPSENSLPLPTDTSSRGEGALQHREGDDDFSGLRTYQAGDSPKRIDWKASSRDQGLLTKQFDGQARASLWLDWHLTAGDTETRLSQLTRWVLDARDGGLSYGLRLPDLEIPPHQGESHDRRCLEALALFGL